MSKRMLFPSKVKKIMQIIGVTTKEEEALCELLSGNFIPKPLNIKKAKLKLMEYLTTRKKK